MIRKSSDKPKLHLFSLAWPIFIEQITSSILFFIDGYFLSLISDQVAAVVGQLHPILLLGFFVLPVFSTAGTAVASQYMGANRPESVLATFGINILFNFILGLLLSLFLLIYSSEIGFWLGMTAEQSETAETYLFILASAFIFLSLRVGYGSILAAKGLTKWNMYASLATNLVNILLNSIFVFGLFGFPSLGLSGVALASVISYACSVLIVLIMVHGLLNMRFSLSIIKPTAKLVIKPLLRLGLPTLLEPVSYCMQQIFIATLVISLGIEAMASQTYTFRLLVFVIAFCWAIAGGAQIIVAYYMGQQQFQAANKMFYRCVLISMSVSLLVVVLYVIFFNSLLGVFTDNESIKHLGMWMLIISLIMEPARAVNIVAGSLLKAVGDAKYTSMVAVVFIWGVIPLVFVISHNPSFGILTIWLCFAVDEVARAVVNIARWRTGKWKSMGVVQDPATTSF